MEWVQIVRGRRPKAEQWPLAPGHRQNRARQTSQQRQHQSGSASLKGSSTPKVPQSPVTTAVRERRTPEQVRSDASTRVSRLQVALDTLADGDVEEKRALQAQKQAEELPLAHQIQVTKDFVDRVRKRMPAADEKIRLAQVALQEALNEKDYDIRELLLAEARLERLQKEVATSRPATPGPAPAVSGLEAEVQRLRAQLAEMQAAQPIRPPQSSALSADLLREKASKRRAGFTETIPSDPQDVAGWMEDKHMELQDAIEFGDQETSHGSDPHWCGTAQEASFHCLQHGCDVCQDRESPVRLVGLPRGRGH